MIQILSSMKYNVFIFLYGITKTILSYLDSNKFIPYSFHSPQINAPDIQCISE